RGDRRELPSPCAPDWRARPLGGLRWNRRALHPPPHAAGGYRPGCAGGCQEQDLGQGAMSHFPLSYIAPSQLFSDYLRVTGIAHLGPEPSGESGLIGKRLGLLNGSSWITLWSNYFGRLYLPGVHLVNAGNEAVQLNFMDAHQKGLPCPPQSNIEAFIRYARDLVELAQVDLVLITCSTMNRAYLQVADALQSHAVPVIQIDEPMMQRAVVHGGVILVVATHGPTVNSTQALLQETASRLERDVTFSGMTVEEAWECLSTGDVPG